jgi:hypothetical protein
VPGADVDRLNREHRGKFLVPHDRVIALEVGGEARAYPLGTMQWHEIVNDTLGGVPIAVTYSPLCDSALVFDRRVGGETLEFGVSGLLYNSNLLMYDRRPEAPGAHPSTGESLWSQFPGVALAGPAAKTGARLAVLPCAVMHWEDWLAAHPRTTVLARVPGRERLYAREPYSTYFASEELKFPVHPPPPEDGPSAKERVIVITAGEGDARETRALLFCRGRGAGARREHGSHHRRRDRRPRAARSARGRLGEPGAINGPPP